MFKDADMFVETDTDITKQVMTLIEDLEKHLKESHKLSLDARSRCGETTEKLMPKTLECTSDWKDIAESGLKLGAAFAEKGMELGFVFASRGMELGYEFASKGEDVGPMANRILFMATQIGVMADRIGETADRILFMADKVGEFGDKILYVSQLVIYTEQLIVNVGVLITETIRYISDLILTLIALVMDKDIYLEQRVELLKNDQALPLVYENMNHMLGNMHEFSLKMLENEARNNEAELKVRELQAKLREVTLSANECFCPCFCVDPASQPSQSEPEVA